MRLTRNGLRPIISIKADNPAEEASAFAQRLLAWCRSREQGAWIDAPGIDFLHEDRWQSVYRDELTALARASKI